MLITYTRDNIGYIIMHIGHISKIILRLFSKPYYCTNLSLLLDSDFNFYKTFQPIFNMSSSCNIFRVLDYITSLIFIL